MLGKSACGAVLGALLLPGILFAQEDLPQKQQRLVPNNPRDLCEVAVSNLTRAQDDILRQHAAPSQLSAQPPTPVVPWDHRTPPRYLDRIERRLAPTAAERGRLKAQGFVVLSRTHPEADSFAGAFHELYQSQLPVYVSADAILHSIFSAHDDLVAELEQRRLLPLITGILDTLIKTLPTARASYPAQIADDLGLYLSVARGLLPGAPPQPAQSSPLRTLMSSAVQGDELKPVELFGRQRMVDFSQYTPRGHYTRSAELQGYFRAVMWLSRLEFNLASRSCRSSAPGFIPDPRETPREVAVALALADLALRAGVLTDLATMEQALSLLAGPREDVSPAQLLDLRARAGIVGAGTGSDADGARLRAAIGNGFQRTANTHYMPQGSRVLPVIATLLGVRAVPDAAALRPLVHDQIPERYLVQAADLGYLLGHDRARDYLATELRTYPALEQALPRAREQMSRALAGDDLYRAWLGAIRALAAPVLGVAPSFMRTPAFADLRLNSALAAFGQLRHNNVLLAGQAYDFGGCEVPDGYVEPAAAVYDALLGYAERGDKAWAQLDPADQSGGRAYFARLRRVLGVLRAVVADELAGRPLSVETRRFLSMVVEMTPGTTGGPPTYTGWYFDLFLSAESALRSPEFISDYYTSVNRQQVAYVGAGLPRLGIFVVDTGGSPRAMVGPVASAYAHLGPLAKRLDDEASKALPDKEREASWAASYLLAAPPEPVGLSVRVDDQGRIELRSERAQGPVTVELLDHHRLVIGAAAGQVRAGITVLSVPLRKGGPEVEAVAVRVGEFRQILDRDLVEGGIAGPIGQPASE